MKKILILSFAALMLASTQVFAEDIDPLRKNKEQAIIQTNAYFKGLKSFDDVFKYTYDYGLRINKASTTEEIDAIVNEAQELASKIIQALNSEFGGMREGSEGLHPAIQVTKDGKTITLYNPDKVTYIKIIGSL